MLVLGSNYEHLEKLVEILSEILNKKYVDEGTGKSLALFLKNSLADQTLSPMISTVIQNKLSQEGKDRI